MKSEIKITDRQRSAVIDIDGVIGVPEQMQFEEPGDRVATYARFAASLARLRELNVDTVVVNIRSTGGDVNDALMIFDALKELNAEVTTRCCGYVASAATIIAQAASEGRREISANALYLIHCSESVAEGNSISMAMTKELLDKTDMRIASIYAASADRPVEDYIALMNENGGKGKWISAEEAVNAGLADMVVPAQIRNEAVDAEMLDDAAELCRLFGLTPPEQVAAADSCGDAGVVDRKSRLYAIWHTFLSLFGGSGEVLDAGCESVVPTESGVADAQFGLPPESVIALPNDKLCVEQGLPSSGGFSSEEEEGVDACNAGSDEEKSAKEIVSSLFKVALPSGKTVVLEHSNLQSEAFATRTVPVEDPSIEQQRKSANQEAYEQDVMSLKVTV